MNHISKIIEKFGGLSAMALCTGFPKTTILSWEDRASMPDRHKERVLEAATSNGVALTKEDFFPVAPEVPHRCT